MDEEIDLLVKLLEHPAGYSLSIFEMISISGVGSYFEVSWEDEKYGKYTVKYKEFLSPQNAARFFVELRYKKQLGLDIEAKLLKQNLSDGGN